MASLIPGLPDDVALFCLARVPRRRHPLLRCVSRRWRDVVGSDGLYSYRQKHSLDETWVYALCGGDKSDEVSCYVLDPKSKARCWRILRGFPQQCMRRKGMGFEVLGRRCYLMGGCGWFQDATHEVYCYDASVDAWDAVAVAPMPTARCFFTCEALDQKLFTVGGAQLNSSDPLSWDTYDPCTNRWTCHSEPKVVPDIADSIVLDGEIYIRCLSLSPPHVCFFVYEPSSGTWKQTDEDMVSGWQGPAVVIDGTLYVLDQSLGTRLMKWEKESREWIAVGRLSPLLTRPPCRLAAVDKSIFIIGKGLSTVVFDVEKARNMGGVMVSSSIAGLASVENVISCKTMTM